ncbi:MAG TPA: hypothetical protein VFP48_11565 [Steroidobacteraceae bacterium]|nr:hypothetical protein [Steroidobacteraceae bacterium]
MKRRAVYGAVVLGVLAVGATGCGLKGSLEMPEKSSNVVIRGPQQAPAGAGAAAPAEASPGTTQPAQPTPATAVPKDDRLPPPPLPEGNPGSAHGG